MLDAIPCDVRAVGLRQGWDIGFQAPSGTAAQEDHATRLATGLKPVVSRSGEETVGGRRNAPTRIEDDAMTEAAIDWASVPVRTVIPGFHGRFAHSSMMTFALWDIEEGAVLPVHAHPHEQVAHVLEGRFELTVEGVVRVLTAGMVGVVLPNQVHSGRALSACRILDVFAPVREDYRDNAASVLQQAAGR